MRQYCPLPSRVHRMPSRKFWTTCTQLTYKGPLPAPAPQMEKGWCGPHDTNSFPSCGTRDAPPCRVRHLKASTAHERQIRPWAHRGRCPPRPRRRALAGGGAVRGLRLQPDPALRAQQPAAAVVRGRPPRRAVGAPRGEDRGVRPPAGRRRPARLARLRPPRCALSRVRRAARRRRRTAAAAAAAATRRGWATVRRAPPSTGARRARSR